MLNWKKKLGYGLEKDEELANYLAQGVQNKKSSRFDTMMSKVVNNAVRSMFVPWLLQCFQKYPEIEFHRRLDPNYCIYHDTIHNSWNPQTCKAFDFIEDMITNHTQWHDGMLKTARRLRYRDWLEVDEAETFDRLETVITKQWGWKLLEHERKLIWNDILRMKRDIYS